MRYHTPVLLNEVLSYLQVEEGKKYIDCTLGDAGHTLEILKNGGTVLGLEINENALQRATARIKAENLDKKFVGVLGNFKNIEEIAKKNGFDQVSGILFDLGYSSFELDEEGMGLSFLKEEPLDMRMDKSLGVTAEDLVNALDERMLAKLIFEYSDEKLARRFARAIVKARSSKRIQTTGQLAEVIKAESPSGYEHGRIHPATRTFQALRIAINGEVDNLDQTLPQAARLLLPGGRMIVISFHSLEDKLVKNFGRSAQPLVTPLLKKPLLPTAEEIAENNRSRSAKMRVFEKV